MLLLIKFYRTGLYKFGLGYHNWKLYLLNMKNGALTDQHWSCQQCLVPVHKRDWIRSQSNPSQLRHHFEVEWERGQLALLIKAFFIEKGCAGRRRELHIKLQGDSYRVTYLVPHHCPGGVAQRKTNNESVRYNRVFLYHTEHD